MTMWYFFTILIIISGLLYPAFALGTPQTCDTSILPHRWPSSHIYITDTNGSALYVPLTDHTAIFHDDDVWNTSPYPRTVQVTLTIQYRYTGPQVFNQTQSLQMQACSGPESVKWRFVPIQDDDYIATVSDDRGKVDMGFYSMHEATKSQTVSLPLEQLRFGGDSHNVICKQDLQLVIKSEDGSPACVKSDTAKTLSERGWAMTLTTGIVPNVYNPSTNASPSAENLTYITPIIPKTHDVRGTVSWALPNISLMKIASTTTGFQISRGGGLNSYDHNSVKLELYYGKTSDSNIIIASTVVNMKNMPVHIYGINIQGGIAYTNDSRGIVLQSTPEIMPKEDAILGQRESQTKYIIGNWTVAGKPVNVFSVSTDYSYDSIENYNGMTNGYQMSIPVQQVPSPEPTSTPQHHPAPVPLTALWGPQASSFDHAKLITGLLTASLPSHVPAELKIGSIRASGNHIGVDFIPKNMTAQQDDTLEKVMGNGGMIIIYSQESPTFNQTAWMRNFVNQMTQEHQVGEINGHPSIIVNADKSAMFILHTDKMVDIESIKYNSSELKKIAQSMLS